MTTFQQPLWSSGSSDQVSGQERKAETQADGTESDSCIGVLPPPGYRKVTKLETLIPGMARNRADNSDEDYDSEAEERSTNARRQKIIRSVRDDKRSRHGKAGDDSDDGWD